MLRWSADQLGSGTGHSAAEAWDGDSGTETTPVGTAAVRAVPFLEDSSAPKPALTGLAVAGPKTDTRCFGQEETGAGGGVPGQRHIPS